MTVQVCLIVERFAVIAGIGLCQITGFTDTFLDALHSQSCRLRLIVT
jgi:hypothetical protein